MSKNIDIVVGRTPASYGVQADDWVGLTDSRTVDKTTPPPTNGMLVMGAGEQSGPQTFKALDGRLAARAGVSSPLVAGCHTYSGATFPSSFSASTQQQFYNYGCKAGILNVKTDWTTGHSLANGDHDSKIQNWPNTMPSDFTLYLICDHEPEDDTNALANASYWRAGQARIANIIAEMDHPRFHYVVCHMGYTFEASSGRNPEDWNPWPLMTSAAKARTIFGPDGYTKMKNTAGTSYDSMDDKLGKAFTKGASWGAERFAVSEHMLNNNVKASGAVCANWWNNVAFPWIRDKNLAYYAFFAHKGRAAGGQDDPPNDGTPYIDTPEEETAFANFCMEFNR